MAYLGNTESDRSAMLRKIGFEQIEDLFEDIPESVRFPELNLPAAKSEMEILAEIEDLARRNTAGVSSFAGAGAYHHFIPAVVP